jgi:hypothetical protein
VRGDVKKMSRDAFGGIFNAKKVKKLGTRPT